MARIYLSPPDIGAAERRYVAEAFEGNWVAPVGPNLEAFEREFAAKVGSPHAVALASGTAALHLALRLTGVGQGDEVLCSTLTFVASAAPITYLNATPVFVDSEAVSWNADPNILADVIAQKARKGRAPRALIIAHLYGQAADLDPILKICEQHGVAVIEDAAEALGATYKGRAPGGFGRFGIHSFNGNKIITTSGGGMLVTHDRALAQAARHLATQARDPAPHYEHTTLGYNYRLSNICAGIGRGQLENLESKVARRRAHFEAYRAALSDLPGLRMQPEAPWGQSTRWLSCLTLNPKEAGVDRERVRLALEKADIETRPIWKPMHLQPVFRTTEYIGRGVSDELFAQGLCLPSGSGMSDADRTRVIEAIRAAFGAH